ncbi:MAG: ankyrin repeat domain-containing protein [Proteobacteria bacterium]|nr:ankyrin repeat domain-containing protein [Pseudomonadota bacterium]
MLNPNKSRFLKAIKKGDVTFLREFLEQHPKYLKKKLHAKLYLFDGFALNMAAYYNQPKVIEFLVTEKHVDINNRRRVHQEWTALHLACHNDAYEAAEALVTLGADMDLPNFFGKTPLGMCSSDPMQERLKELFARTRLARDKAEQTCTKSADQQDIWRRISPGEIMHERVLPENGYRITDIFNFEARYWTSIVRDPTSGTPTQNRVFFDNMPDTRILHQAHAKYVELGGTIPAEAIDRRPRKAL